MDDISLKIKKKIEEILLGLGFEGDVIVAKREGMFHADIEVDSPAILIGRGGEGLDALQYIVRILFSQELFSGGEDVIIDILGYRQKKAELLEKRAKDKAFLVLSTGIEEVLPPMSSYERRVVHMICANIADIETESRGEGRERRVVIKPKRS